MGKGINQDLMYIVDTELPCVYSIQQLRSMLITMGIKPDGDSVTSFYTQVCNYFLTVDTFYPISHLTTDISELTTTCINMIPIADVPSQDLLLYGTINRTKRIVSFDEIADTLAHNGTYNNFMETDRKVAGNFQDSIVNRLRYLSEKYNKTKLATIISHIDNKENADAKTWSALRDTYRKTSGETQAKIYNMLLDLIKLGMFMRGWSGKTEQPYPVWEAKAPTDKRAILQQELDIHNLCTALEELESKDAPELKLIMDLPLYRYCDGKFIIPPGQGVCRTVRERIALARKGDGPNVSTDSCIRMSSNYIIGSAYYAIQFIGLPTPFSIVTLKYVS